MPLMEHGDHSDCGDSPSAGYISRRQAILMSSTAAFIPLSWSLPQPLQAINWDDQRSLGKNNILLESSSIFAVKTDSTPKASPSTYQLSATKIINALQSKRAVFLGEHHPEFRDHLLQAALIRRLHASVGGKPLAVGIEAVQRQFQPVLDDYIAGRIDEQELIAATDWERRWFWSFTAYAPVFLTCRELGVKLIALDVDSEDKAKVELGGLSSLGKTKLLEYVPDEEGFDRFGRTRAFHEYVSYTLSPPYNLQKKFGQKMTTSATLERNISFTNFLARQAWRDEGMASTSAGWLTKNPGGLMLGLLGGNHVKFGCGVPARTARMLPGGLNEVASVLINPTPFDTEADLRRCSGTTVANEGCLRNEIEVQNYVLQLGFAEFQALPTQGETKLQDQEEATSVMQIKEGSSVLALSDYIIISPRTSRWNST